MKQTVLIIISVFLAAQLEAVHADDELRLLRPNVLSILADDMGYADCGAHRCRDIPTLHLDSRAVGGVPFANGYLTGTVCLPRTPG